MDPNPFKHPAIILARLRSAIEPSLFAAGFRFQERNKPVIPLYLYLDYSRPGELFRLSWDRRDSNRFIGITAELLREPEGYVRIATTDLHREPTTKKDCQTAEIQMLLDAFIKQVTEFLNNLSSFAVENHP